MFCIIISPLLTTDAVTILRINNVQEKSTGERVSPDAIHLSRFRVAAVFILIVVCVSALLEDRMEASMVNNVAVDEIFVMIACV